MQEGFSEGRRGANESAVQAAKLVGARMYGGGTRKVTDGTGDKRRGAEDQVSPVKDVNLVGAVARLVRDGQRKP